MTAYLSFGKDDVRNYFGQARSKNLHHCLVCGTLLITDVVAILFFLLSHMRRQWITNKDSDIFWNTGIDEVLLVDSWKAPCQGKIFENR